MHNMSHRYGGTRPLGYTRLHNTKVHSRINVERFGTSKRETGKKVIPIYHSTNGEA